MGLVHSWVGSEFDQKTTLSLLLIHGITLTRLCYVSVISYCIQQMQNAVWFYHLYAVLWGSLVN